MWATLETTSMEAKQKHRVRVRLNEAQGFSGQRTQNSVGVELETEEEHRGWGGLETM